MILGTSTCHMIVDSARHLAPGESGLLALDWWNGCRTPLVDAHLSGLLLGLTLATRPPDIFRALIEATAFGTQTIVETFEASGIAMDNGGTCPRSDRKQSLRKRARTEIG